MKTGKFLVLMIILLALMPGSFAQNYGIWDLNIVEKDGKYGYSLYDADPDNLLIDYQFEEAGIFYYPGLAKVKKNGKYGYINLYGNVVIDFQFEDACQFIEEYTCVKKDGLWGMISIYGKKVVDFRYEMAFAYTEGAAPVMLNGKFGYIDKEGNALTPFMFDKVTFFLERTASGLADSQVFTLQKDKYQPVPVNDYGTYSFLVGDNIEAYFSVEQYDELTDEILDETSPELPYGNLRTGWSILSFSEWNSTAVEPFADLNQFSEGLLAIRPDSLWGFVNRNGEEVISCKYEDAGYFSGGLANVQSGGKWGYINHQDGFVIRPAWDYAAPFKGQNAWIVQADRIVPINKEGQAQPTGMLQQIFRYQEGLAAVNINGKMGYADASGKIIIAPQFAYAGDFYDGRAVTWNEGWYRYIRMDGSQVSVDRYYSATDFCQGGAIVSTEYTDPDHNYDWPIITYSIIDTAGRMMGDNLFTDIKRFHQGLVAASPFSGSLFNDIYWTGMKWGYFDLEGREAISVLFDEAGDFNGGCALVNQEGARYFIDFTGEQVSETFYEVQSQGQPVIASKVTSDFSDFVYTFIDRCGKPLNGWFRSISQCPMGGFIIESDTAEGIPSFAFMSDSLQVMSGYYEGLEIYSDNLCRAYRTVEDYNEQYTFLDKNGRETCQWLTGSPEYYTDDYSMVMKVIEETEQTRYALLNNSTGRITDEWYDYIGTNETGFAVAELINPVEDMEFGYTVIDETGKRLCGWLNDIPELNFGFFVVTLDKGQGLGTKAGIVLIKPYITFYDITEGVALVEADGYYMFVDQEGRVFSDKWVEARTFSDGMAVVKQKKSGCGYIDRSGILVIPYQFSMAEDFSEGLAVVTNEAINCGYVDKTGKMVTGFEFDTAYPFYGGRALVSKDGEEYYIDTSGKRVE
jgi:hypothetical protein